MNTARTTVTYSGSPSYQLEGRTAKNLYRGPSGELQDKLDKIYEATNRRNKSFSDPKEHIRRKYFDTTYAHYRVLDGRYHSAERVNAYQNEMNVLYGGKPIYYSVEDYKYRGNEAPRIHGEIESFRSYIHDRLNMDFQISELFQKNGIQIPKDASLIFRSDLYTRRISVLGNIDDSLKQDIEAVLNQGKNAFVLSLHIAQSLSGLSQSQQDNPEKSRLWNLAGKIFRYTGIDMRDLEARDGSFFTKDGEDIFTKISEGVKEATKENTKTEQLAALSMLAANVEYFSEKGILKENAYFDIQFKDGHLLDMYQKYKYGVGQNSWIHDMAREKGVDDYELSKDGIKLIAKGKSSPMYYSKKISVYQPPYQDEELQQKLDIRKALDDFFRKNRFDIPIGTRLNIFYEKIPDRLFVYGIQNTDVSEEVNTFINKDKELLSLFSLLSVLSFSAKA